MSRRRFGGGKAEGSIDADTVTAAFVSCRRDQSSSSSCSPAITSKSQPPPASTPSLRGAHWPPVVPLHPVICHMEGSGRWPQDKEAIKRIKAAFHLQLAELLQQQHQLICRPAVTHTDVYKVGGRGGFLQSCGLRLLWYRGACRGLWR